MCMFPGQKVFYFWVILNITETAVNVGGTLHENQNIYLYIYSFMRDNANYVGALTHNYVRHCVLRYFLQMQHCRIMNFNLHIVEVIFEMSLWIWTQVFLALETRIKPSDKQATCVLNESTSWVRSDMLSDVCVCPGEEHTYEGSLVDHYDNVVSPQPGEHSDSFCPFLPGRMWPAGSAFCAFLFSK